MGHFDDPKQIRDAPLPHSFRGFDEEATRGLLDRIARAHQALLAECERLRAELALVQAEQQSAPPQPVSEADEAGAMTEMLLAAKRTADQIVDAANRKADGLLASAERERAEILDNASKDAESRSAGLRADVESLSRERDWLHNTIAQERGAFTEVLQRALRELDRPSVEPPEVDLPDVLQSQVAPNAST
jgi:cell division septum initiation protein DivIVA